MENTPVYFVSGQKKIPMSQKEFSQVDVLKMVVAVV